MSKKRKSIELFIQNNTGGVVPMSILNQLNDLDISNALTEYRWDVTAETYTGKDTVSIQFRAKAAATLVNKVLPLRTQSLAGVLTALNTMGIATFFSYVSGPTTYISTYTDNYVFSTLDIYNSAAPVTVNLSSRINDLLTGYALSGYNFQGYKNAVLRFTHNSQPGDTAFNDTIQLGDVLRFTGTNPAGSTNPIRFAMFGNALGTFYIDTGTTINPGQSFDQSYTVTQTLINNEGSGGLVQAYIGGIN